MTNSKPTTIDSAEVEKFSKIADEWWDLSGKFKPLHDMNRARLDFIREQIIEKFRLNPKSNNSLAGIKVLDVGCGGGILSESLARLGAEVTGIDASVKNIKVASLHAKETGLNIEYLATTVEELVASGRKFDVVLAMEVVEHVADVSLLFDSCAAMLAEQSLFFLSTINRTLKSYAMAIIGAEYVLRWLPIGTHDWNKFLKPSEISSYLGSNDLKIVKMHGIGFNLINKTWQLTDNVDVNYILCSDR